MSEPITPKNPVLAASDRNFQRLDLWDRFMRMGQKFCTEMRRELQEDPWDEDREYTNEQVAKWEEAAQKISVELDALLSETDEFLCQVRPAGFKTVNQLGPDAAPF